MNLFTIANSSFYKVALYIRLSKEDDKKGESESISNQRSILTRFCQENHLHIIAEYIDDGISGTTFQRPSFQKMLKDIENNKINMVITKDLSRLGRDYIGTGHFLEKYFPEKHVRYISLLDGIDTGIESISNDITPFKSILNDMYAKDISNKIKSVKHNKQELGLFIGRKAPFGYLLKKEFPNKLFIDIEAKPIIERIFQEACSGKSCRAIATDLTLDKIPTPSQYAMAHGNKVTKVSYAWTDSRIREILLNEVYIGNMVQGRMKKINYKSKQNIRLPKEEWKIIPNTHEAMIDPKTFSKANEMLELRKKTRIKSHDYLLKGFVYCHECGKKLNCTSKKGVYYFRCSTYVTYTKLRYCSSHFTKMEYVENSVLSKLIEIITSIDTKEKMIEITKQLLKKKQESRILSSPLEEYKQKLSSLLLEIDTMYHDKLQHILSQEDFIRIYKQKVVKKKLLQEKINHLLSLPSIPSEHESIEELIQKFYSSFAICRETLADLIQRIEIDQDKNIYLYLKFKQ